MTKQEFAKLAKRYGGWMEGDIARFPSVHQKTQFEDACDAIYESEYEAKLHADELAHDRYLDSLEYGDCPHARSVTTRDGEGAFCYDCGETLA